MKKATQNHLQTIAERLWSGQASLLVGAGFSKNAIVSSDGKLPPNWNQLGDLFFEKTRGRWPRRTDRAYVSVLRLAEEVENMHGRPALIELIKNAICDDNLFPSDIHTRLLELPWDDVFTTNFDTLLERSAFHLKEQKKRSYSIVRNSQNMGMPSSPLLVKLHGDLNDPMSIVITEEDYRTYPDSHQAMINYIQHTIMTRTLVLIGFSGNDPNFLQWLGWVKDALNNNLRKLFLLSIDDISEAERVSFEKKNVIVVDLRQLAKKNANPYDTIAAAITYLEDFFLKREKENADYRRVALKWGRSSNRDEDLNSTFVRWESDRKSYPGWLVMPRDRRELWADMEGFSLSEEKLAQLTGNKDILFLDLFNWRIERCLFPIDNSWEQIYLNVLSKYSPFSRRSRPEIRSAWLNLKFGLLRLYRQEGWHNKWDSLRDSLSPLKERMDDNQRCRFDYEQALEAIYRKDFQQLELVLKQWTSSQSDPYWDIRQGALWAEYLSLEKGREITQTAFNRICNYLEKSDNEHDRFYWASRKVHAHTVWNCMAQANFSDGSDETSSARETWLELRPYDDIWFEREFFDAHLRSIEEALRIQTKTASFRLGYSSTSTNLSGNSKDFRIAYAYFLYYEETGFPIHLPYLNSIEKPSLLKALSVMGYCSPLIADCWMLRSGDPKMVPAIYNRRFLDRTRYQDVTALYEHYLGCFYNLLQVGSEMNVPSWVLVLRSILPEVLSRLCMKASYEARVKTLDYLDSVFRNKNSIHYDGLDRLLSSLVDSFTTNEIVDLIPRFISMAIDRDRLGDCRLDPLYYVENPHRINSSVSSVVDNLLDRFGTDEQEEKDILYRLVFLNECKALSKAQQSQLAEKLWSNRDVSGFPERTVFSRFAFLSFPHPNDVEPQVLLKEYFLNQTLPLAHRQSSISLNGGRHQVLNDLKGTANDGIAFIWDAPLLNTICERLIMMWDCDKGRLLEETVRGFGISVREEFEGRFNDVETIIIKVFAPNIKLLNNDNVSGLIRLSTEFESYAIPAFRMRVALDAFDEHLDLDNEIRSRLGSSDSRIVDDCKNAIILLYNRGVNVHNAVEIMSESFRNGSESGRNSIINGIKYFVEKGVYKNNNIIQTNISVGLKRLFIETEIDKLDDELNANKKMFLRKSVAPIVKLLYFDSSFGENDILTVWKGYFEDEETCLDIRKSFNDAI